MPEEIMELRAVWKHGNNVLPPLPTYNWFVELCGEYIILVHSKLPQGIPKKNIEHQLTEPQYNPPHNNQLGIPTGIPLITTQIIHLEADGINRVQRQRPTNRVLTIRV
jgi:hypothetical protein